ncbi:unnamed protein product [Thlaspi arvense]|uniref:MAK16-like protein n=1 Tax=Thlaspi arvense TaxID=13288 RepID=A0AAU9S477_THLAR|nr:unnamed protein product [Thlaspi arvense]
MLEKIMTTPRKEKKREARREEKAEKAAVLDKSIEKELLERLKRGVYGDIYNYPVKEFYKVIDMEDQQAASEDEEEEPEIEYVEGYEELEEEEDIEDFGGLPNCKSYPDFDDAVGTDDEDEESLAVERKRVRKDSQRKLEKDEPGSKLKKKARVLVEVEHEDTEERQMAVHYLDKSRAFTSLMTGLKWEQLLEEMQHLGMSLSLAVWGFSRFPSVIFPPPLYSTRSFIDSLKQQEPGSLEIQTGSG